MSFLDRAKAAAGQASERAKVAADQMSEQARRAAEQAGEQAHRLGEQAKEGASSALDKASAAAERANAAAWDPATTEKTQRRLRAARQGFQTAVERIDPGVLADIIIKATMLQERANASLRSKGSPYRIAEIAIGAAIPPSITFSIARVDDPTTEERLEGMPWAAAPAAGVTGGAIVTLDGSELDDADPPEPT